MKTTLMIVCTISAMCVVGAVQKPNARKTSISESELRALATVAPTAKNAGQLYSVAMATTNDVGRQQELLKAAAACLIACGKNDVYKKHVKGKLQGVVRFENELKDNCKQCSGAGTKDRRCSECSGRGQCSRCKGAGQTTHVGFDRNNTVKTCSKCNGDRRCSKCGGEGSRKEKCVTCAGTGKAFSEDVAARIFRDSCNAIADSMKFAHESTNGMAISEKGKATGAVNTNAECNQGLSHENSCFSASELQALAGSIPDVKSGGKLYSAAMATTNNIDQQKYLKAAAACLVACGKNDVYKNRVKGKLLNAAEFESEVTEECKQCSGSGMKKQRCNDCNGNCRCSRCTVGFSQRATCSKCNSSGRCPKCNGKGYKEEKCVTCVGTGKVFNKANATCVFRDLCNVIADGKSPEKRRTGQQNVTKAQPIRRRWRKSFAEMCKANSDAASVIYNSVTYTVLENADGDDNFVVLSHGLPSSMYAYSFVIFPTSDSRDQWYESVVECTEKLKSWIRISADKKIEHVTKEIPISEDVFAYANRITHGRGQADLMRRAVRESYEHEVDTHLVKFLGTINAKDTFNRYRVSIGMTCGDSFNSRIFFKYGTIEEIDNELATFLTFVNPKALENARETQAKKEDLFR